MTPEEFDEARTLLRRAWTKHANNQIDREQPFEAAVHLIGADQADKITIHDIKAHGIVIGPSPDERAYLPGSSIAYVMWVNEND